MSFHRNLFITPRKTKTFSRSIHRYRKSLVVNWKFLDKVFLLEKVVHCNKFFSKFYLISLVPKMYHRIQPIFKKGNEFSRNLFLWLKNPRFLTLLYGKWTLKSNDWREPPYFCSMSWLSSQKCKEHNAFFMYIIYYLTGNGLDQNIWIWVVVKIWQVTVSNKIKQILKIWSSKTSV